MAAVKAVRTLYFKNDPPSDDFLPSNLWDDTNTLSSTKALSTVAPSAGTLASAEGQGYVFGRRWVSEPLEPFVIAGKVEANVQFRKSQFYIGDVYAHFVIRLFSKLGTEKALILSKSHSEPLSIGLDPYSVSVDLPNLEIKQGDRIVVECGAHVMPTTGSGSIEVYTNGGSYLTMEYIPAPEPRKRLTWSNKRPPFEIGIDRGVLYPEEGPGVAWNGLLSVDDSYVGGEIEPLYVDGVLYHNLPSGRNYQANLVAYSAPDEFGPCMGEIEAAEGVILTRQPRQRFGLSYRTLVGDGLGYKIHLVYNALATPDSRSHVSLNGSPSPDNLSWVIDAVPVESNEYAPRPTAHYILDSTEIGKDQLAAVEGLLYGTVFGRPRLPPIRQIIAITTNWDPKIIVPDYVYGESTLIDGLGDVQEIDVEGVYIPLPDSRLYETGLGPGLYRLMESE